jgi:hypothetical protein
MEGGCPAAVAAAGVDGGCVPAAAAAAQGWSKVSEGQRRGNVGGVPEAAAARNGGRD